jgi:hypothetical protein
MDLRWKHPFSAIVAGPSGSGKSVFVSRFIKHISDMCNVQFNHINWHYGSGGGTSDDGNSSTSKVKYIEGLPDLEDFDGKEPTLVIIDDLMREADNRVVDFFTKGCHHKNISVFFITQNLFHQGKGQRDISLNAHYIVCFKNPRDKVQFKCLARQIHPENQKFIEEAYSDATSSPHGYLLLDLKQATPDDMRIQSCIFPDDTYHFVYTPKQNKKKK